MCAARAFASPELATSRRAARCRSTGSLVGGTAMYFLGAETAFRIMGGVAALASASYGCFCCFRRSPGRETEAAAMQPRGNAVNTADKTPAVASASNEDGIVAARTHFPGTLGKSRDVEAVKWTAVVPSRRFDWPGIRDHPISVNYRPSRKGRARVTLAQPAVYEGSRNDHPGETSTRAMRKKLDEARDTRDEQVQSEPSSRSCPEALDQTAALGYMVTSTGLVSYPRTRTTLLIVVWTTSMCML
ncbi:hypothetical protein HPB50_007056 [Hyalomma asiaticum]|uniref:Uncharacterized protein n=1 Tax=Hyalomma asiaticum TaxID=266040 RepID=A0ACB7SLP5_HYAAI|nr:hypothetical protein HPB50_007056 [Hyalomma asiaticum]